jgi:hypothetical protein
MGDPKPQPDEEHKKTSREHDLLQCEGCIERLLGRACAPPLNGGPCLDRRER